MTSFMRGALRCLTPLAAIIFVTACTSDDRPVVLSRVEIAPAPQIAAQSNQNVENPTLVVANNYAVRRRPARSERLVLRDG